MATVNPAECRLAKFTDTVQEGDNPSVEVALQRCARFASVDDKKLRAIHIPAGSNVVVIEMGDKTSFELSQAKADAAQSIGSACASICSGCTSFEQRPGSASPLMGQDVLSGAGS